MVLLCQPPAEPHLRAFPARGSPVIHAESACFGARPAWMASWQARQAISVLRFRDAINLDQVGTCFRLWRLRSAILRRWWTSTRMVLPQSSHASAWSRSSNSVPLVYEKGGR